MMSISTDLKFTLPIVAVLQRAVPWIVSVQKCSGETEFSFREGKASAHKFSISSESSDFHVFPTEPVMEVRSGFFSIRSPEDALRFFERFGPFELPRIGETSGRKSERAKQTKRWFESSGQLLCELPAPESPFRVSTRKTGTSDKAVEWVKPIRWSQIEQAQADFKAALTGKSISWSMDEFVFRQPLGMLLQLPKRFYTVLSPVTDVMPTGFVLCNDVVEAIRASIFLSKLKGSRWNWCQREGCNKIFEQTSKHARKYCDEDCAHYQAVLKFNANRGKEATQRKKKKL